MTAMINSQLTLQVAQVPLITKILSTTRKAKPPKVDLRLRAVHVQDQSDFSVCSYCSAI